MARAIADIQKDIRALASEDRAELLRSVIAELDAPADANSEKAWLAESQRRYRELIEGHVKAVPGRLVFERLRARLGA